MVEPEEEEVVVAVGPEVEAVPSLPPAAVTGVVVLDVVVVSGVGDVGALGEGSAVPSAAGVAVAVEEDGAPSFAFSAPFPSATAAGACSSGGGGGIYRLAV